MIILMEKIEILSLIVTIICLLSFSIVFTVLFRNYNLTAIDSIKEGNEDIDLIDSCLDEEKKKKSKKHKVLHILSKIVYFTLYIAVFGFFAFSLTSRIMDNNMLIGDTGIVVIATGSMSEKHKDNTYLDKNDLNNQFNAYDIIQIKKYKENESPKLYDVVAFKAKDGRTIVHRITEVIPGTNETPMTFKTKGDANPGDDYGALYDKLTEDDIIGYYTGKNVPAIGSFVIFLQSNSGIITIVSIGYCVFMFDYYRNKLEKTITNRTNLLIDLINYDENEPEISNSFRQELVYQGYAYVFDKGNFIRKYKVSDNDSINSKDDNVELKENEANEKSEIDSDAINKLDDLLNDNHLEINENKDENSIVNEPNNALDSLNDLLDKIKKE